MSTTIDRRAVLAGAASAAVTAPAIAAPTLEPDPIFAAIEAYKSTVPNISSWNIVGASTRFGNACRGTKSYASQTR
jgi:hypothetical protein